MNTEVLLRLVHDLQLRTMQLEVALEEAKKELAEPAEENTD